MIGAGTSPADLLLRQRRARQAEAGGPPPIPRLPDDRPVRLSFTQERLWLLDQLDPGEPTYLVPATLQLEGPLRLAALRAALGDLSLRHEALRTRIAGPDPSASGQGFPVQTIEPPAPVHLGVCDLSGLPRDGARGEARRVARAEAARPMALEGGPLARWSLVRLGPEEHLLLVTLHHVVADGWSIGVLAREIQALHEAHVDGRTPELPELPVRFRDFAVWQRERLAAENRERHLEYWRQRLAGAPVLLELPTDHPRPPLESHRGGLFLFSLPAELVRGAVELGRSLGAGGGGSASPFMVLLAAYQLLLGRLAGSRDVVVGTPVAGRDRVETEGMIGFFANTVALRAEIDPRAGFRTLVQSARDGVLADLSHQDLPFEELVAALQPQRDLSHAPVFQALFVFQTASGGAPARAAGPAEPGERRPLVVRRSEAHGGTAKFDLTMILVPTPDGGLIARLEHSRDLFDPATAERWAGHYATLLAAAVAEPDRPVAGLPLLTASEEEQVVVGWNDTARELDGGALLHELVVEQARRTPDLPALRFRDERLDYRGLDDKSAGWARRLAAAGVGAEVRVGVAMERCLELPLALLAVLRAGGAYLPLDPSYPDERLRFMIADGLAGGEGTPAIVLTQERFRERFAALAPEGVRWIAVDGWDAGGGAAEPGPAPPSPPPESAAYVIYTSGSTGRPKGVVNAHRAISNRLLWMRESFDLGPGDRVLQKTPFSFDVSVWELFEPLVTGAELVIAEPDGHRDPAYLVRTIAEAGITVLHFVPSMLQAFLEQPGSERLTSVRWVAASGEALSPELVRRFHERMGGTGARLHNLYGPTEAAVEVSWHPCADPRPARVPIGRPISNLRLHVLDARLAAAPPGVSGHLALAGVGLARGYHARPALTADRFRPDPFAGRGDGPAWAPGGRIYLAGDAARHLPDGEVDYLGRLDRQVKIRGLRVELGEIEAALVELPEVRDAAVLVLPSGGAGGAGPAGGDLRLVAYVVAAGEGIDPQALRAALGRRLPEYMVPMTWVRLEAMPLSASGKIDRRALPDPAPDAGEADRFVPPATAAEELLAEIWAEVLGRDGIGTHDDFFALGGHSLLATQVVLRIGRELGLEVPVRQVFQTPVLADFAADLESRLVDDAEVDDAEVDNPTAAALAEPAR